MNGVTGSSSTPSPHFLQLNHTALLQTIWLLIPSVKIEREVKEKERERLRVRRDREAEEWWGRVVGCPRAISFLNKNDGGGGCKETLMARPPVLVK